MITLNEALNATWQHDWQHRRSGQTLWSQARKAAIHVGLEVLERTAGEGEYPADCVLRSIGVDDVRPEDIRNATARFCKDGASPATIQKRLNCLSKLGVAVEGCRVKVPKQLKWHLKEDVKPRVLAWLREESRLSLWETVGDFIEWTTLTGLRIEESLALVFTDFSEDSAYISDRWGFGAVSVPGLKTATSQATLPIGVRAAQIISRRHQLVKLDTTTGRQGAASVFPVTYEELNEVWQEVRKAFGWQDDPTATLKALRRSAARYLHIDCGMPLHMVQQYLRHESMDTTLEYLRLTGGYGTEEMRRFLK